jgi:hypothetical protein
LAAKVIHPKHYKYFKKDSLHIHLGKKDQPSHQAKPEILTTNCKDDKVSF